MVQVLKSPDVVVKRTEPPHAPGYAAEVEALHTPVVLDEDSGQVEAVTGGLKVIRSCYGVSAAVGRVVGKNKIQPSLFFHHLCTHVYTNNI